MSLEPNAYYDHNELMAVSKLLDLDYSHSFTMQRRVDTTMDAIKSYILREKLKPGDLLPTEARLCELLRSSRSSVREALRKLEALDIVSVSQGKGTFVGGLSLEPLVETLSFRAMIPQQTSNYSDLRDVIELRKIIDRGCAMQVIEGISSMPMTELVFLEQITNEMLNEANTGHTFLSQDIAFHMGMLAPVPNTITKQITQSLWIVHMAVLPVLGLQPSSSLQDTAQAHRNMLDAARRKDIDAYYEAVEMHYKPIEEILLSYQNDHQED